MFALKIAPTKESRRAWRMMTDKEQYLLRAEKLKAQVSRYTSGHVYDALKRTIPKGATYRKSIRLAEVTGLPEGQYAHAVYAPKRAAAAKNLPKAQTLVYVRQPKRASRRGPSAILAKYGPWPIDRLPTHTDPRRTVFRKVSAERVSSNRRRLDSTKRVWKSKLMRAGVVPKKPIGLKGLKGVQNFALEALQSEFGLTRRAKAVWRPAVLGARGALAKMGSGESPFVRAMTDPGFSAYKEWPSKAQTKIPYSSLADYVAFQERLGLNKGR